MSSKGSGDSGFVFGGKRTGGPVVATPSLRDFVTMKEGKCYNCAEHVDVAVFDFGTMQYAACRSCLMSLFPLDYDSGV